MESKTILKEAKNLYNLGIAVHWLRPNSKIPVNGGWTNPKRDDWQKLLAEYQQGFGLGIRLGQASIIEGEYLTVIDFDIRSKDSRFFEEAKAVLETHFPNLYETAAFVQTGRGFGSCHLYFFTDELFSSQNIGRSKEKVKVYSPSSQISGEQLRGAEEGLISKNELAKGWRLKTAWEIDLMSQGKQVVAPPTKHPDTKKPYIWIRGLV